MAAAASTSSQRAAPDDLVVHVNLLVFGLLALTTSTREGGQG